jgi:hypothetical protein
LRLWADRGLKGGHSDSVKISRYRQPLLALESLNEPTRLGTKDAILGHNRSKDCRQCALRPRDKR